MHIHALVGLRQLTVLKTIIVIFCGIIGVVLPARADLPQTIEKVRGSVVGVGTYQKTRTPAMNMLGTGFIVADGLHVITNVHVKPPFLDTEQREVMVVVTGRGKEVQVREVEEVASDPDHDVALLKIKGTPLPAMILGDPSGVREGQQYAFTGFPIGAILGLYHVTHKATISSLTPIVIPSRGSRDLDVKSVARLRKAFDVFQLDATAYPGNSGSPLYDPATGHVVGVLNMVFVKQTKENVLSDPSGIAYAIPISHVTTLLKRANVKY
jgi:serine protease Do